MPGRGLQPGRNVYTITKKVAPLDHDIADMHADAEIDVTVRGPAHISFGKRRLCLDRALNSIDGTQQRQRLSMRISS
jgi:hypothetical protein